MSLSKIMRLSVAGTGILFALAPAFGRDTRAGTLHLTGAWSRPTPPAAPAGVGYLSIVNAGPRADRLLGGTSSAVERVEIHEMKLTDGIMRMRPVSGGVPLQPGKTVTFAPGGYHLMLVGPKQPLVVCGAVTITLRFQRAGAVKVSFDVRATPPVSIASEQAR